MSPTMIWLFLNSVWQTFAMVTVSCVVAVVLGLLLGIILLITRDGHLWPQPHLHKTLGLITNALRSIPFIILMIAIIPFTRWLVGTSIGMVAVMVPLTIAAIPFVGRLVETTLEKTSRDLIEAAESMGATTLQIVFKVLLPESWPMLIRGITLTYITLIGYSAMAGAIGGGGLGDLAIRYGYQRFDITIMLITIGVLILFVQVIQMLGDWIARILTH